MDYLNSAALQRGWIYTVMGDPVNIAARLQDMTRAAGTDILIDENTRKLLGDRSQTGRINNAKIRGREGLMGIYVLKSLRESK